MTQKFNYDGYTLCVTFRSDNALGITASYNMTGQHFINDMVELGKIKKDTVLATLARKSQKNLWCKFKMIDSEPRKLVVSFVVKFDFLPEFSEDVTLEYIQVKEDVFNKISSVELKSDMDEVQKVLDAISSKGTIDLKEKGSTTLNKLSEYSEFDLNQGSYLLQISGVLTNTTQAGDIIEFSIEQKNQPQIKIRQKTHTTSSYGYPFFITQRIDSKGGLLKISAKNSLSGTASLTSQIVTLIPIVPIAA